MAEQRGLMLVYTGNGKGKTTAAMGMAVRHAAWKKPVCIVQFLKSPDSDTGEREFFKDTTVEIYPVGIGFSWTKSPEEQRESIRKAWVFAKEKIADPRYDMVILDEINGTLSIKDFPIDDVIPLNEVLEAIRNRPSHQHIVLTGRNAKDEIVEMADLVSEVKEIKHYFQAGISNVKGIEY